MIRAGRAVRSNLASSQLAVRIVAAVPLSEPAGFFADATAKTTLDAGMLAAGGAGEGRSRLARRDPVEAIRA